MNILVIGNGFDLAHGLPTKYTDFLEFLKSFMEYYKNKNNNLFFSKWKCDNDIKLYIRQMFSKIFSDNKEMDERKKIIIESAKEIINELQELIFNNIWIDYFLQNDTYQKENWIDFEFEISKVIQSLDNDWHSVLSEGYNIDDTAYKLSNYYLNKIYADFSANHSGNIRKRSTFEQIRNDLLEHLIKLIRALEIYLSDYVEKLECNCESPDIKKIRPDRVLSFNYTNTYEKIYGIENVKFDYIHGKADLGRTIELNNMVLGIDEYLPKKRRDKEVEFVAFKKFYQRIHKQTGCKYKEWITEIAQEKKFYKEHIHEFEMGYKKNRESGDEGQDTRKDLEKLRKNPPKHDLYIFGHSLDVTDKDVLKELILCDNVFTTIFYVNKDVMGQQIANLVKVIGQDELIKRTGGSTKTIEFKQQHDMVEINR